MNDSSIHPEWGKELNQLGSGSNRNIMDQDQITPGGEQQVAADANAETVQQASEPSTEGEVIEGTEEETDEDE